MKYKFALVACARWEGESISEWVAYHRAIGFEHIYLYCNDNDPTELYERLAPVLLEPTPFITFVHYPFQGMQSRMYKHFLSNFAQETAWFAFLDLDEFLALKTAPRIQDFMLDYENSCDALYFNWILFGNNGFSERPPGSILLQYTKRDTRLSPYTKMITRTAALDIPRIIAEGEAGFWHDWGENLGRDLRLCNVIKDDAAGYYKEFPRNANVYLDTGSKQREILSTAVVHHYAFRSERDIERRIARGLAGEFEGQLVFKKVQDSNNVEAFLAQLSKVEDTFLRDRWRAFLNGGWRASLVPQPPGRNIALGKPATQSSVSEWSRETTREADAGRAVSGVFSGWFNCHTDLEDRPWWRVDLGAAFRITQVRIYNRSDNPHLMLRNRHIALQASGDDVIWHTLCQKTDESAFGGIDSMPFIWDADRAVIARFIRIQLLDREFLHLDQVEVYGG